MTIKLDGVLQLPDGKVVIVDAAKATAQMTADCSPKTGFELGELIAKRLFDDRSRNRGFRNVEVHLTEGELRDLLCGVAELARLGYEKK